MSQERFADRHIGPSREETQEMLRVIGVESISELVDQIVPADIRLPQPLDLPQAMSEFQFGEHIRQLAARNKPLRTFIGMGYYPTTCPAAIVRNVFENPAWYTSYTPYQAEISQGRLEALLNFQTAITSLTGMEISNCSLLDEASAAAEAMALMFNQRSRGAIGEGRNVLFVDENIFPQTLDLLLTRSEPLGIEITCDDLATYQWTGREFGAILQYPGANGAIPDCAAFTAEAHRREVLVTAVADILSLALIQSPGEWGADVVVGSTQRLGTPMGYGGAHAAYLATREAFKRQMPGRIIGVSIDRLGNRALRMALQTREQHIKRERATSNICTAQALLASMAGFFAVYHGAEGLKRIALNAHRATSAVARAAGALGYRLVAEDFFDTVEMAADADRMRIIAEAHGLNFYYPDEETVHLSFDEVTTPDEIRAVIAVLAEAAGRPEVDLELDESDETGSFNPKFARQTPFLTEPIFRKYQSETELMRYIKQLELRDISLANSMIPLGSCTMKLNSAASMMPLSLAEFGNIHPFVPRWQAEGYDELIESLSRYLAVITGLAAVSLQPNSGAHGEFTGLMVIRAYHASRGDFERDIALIPASAHGTNPASAVMAGMRVVVVATDERGNIDIDDLRAKAVEHRDRLSCLIVTYPSTHGVFESGIREMVAIVHENGGQVYMDGANMNAQVGLTNPGYIGADVCHLNLHKTFASPHGGGGPGVGPIGVAKHLVQFLPTHPIVQTGGQEGITAVAAAPWGSASLLPITYAYIRMLGGEGLKRATEMALVNANYLASTLKAEYGILYTGQTGRVAHEMILDTRHFKKEYGVETADLARRLMDYGFHAPTVSFPVHETLMVEPTESESKAEMDRFVEALVAIKRECEAIRDGQADATDNVVNMAPHTAFEATGDGWTHPYPRHKAVYPLAWVADKKFWPAVSRIDSGYGDRNLVCRTEE
ncbi:MAG: aminomethyl-transferring glycine dehydrogenase [Rikenellaceae bacterium]|jgi:glycine dehydrogenase|nr:aminomethyl-transferring glycine dehydrogenase [Rikenellaceae bacterium]